MDDFKREERYYVYKISDLSDDARDALARAEQYYKIPTRECAVVESDWPIYEETWRNIQQLTEGKKSLAAELEDDLHDAWRERDALAAEAAEYKQDGEQWKAAHDEVAQREQSLAALVEAANTVFRRGAAFEVAGDGGTAWAVDPAEVADWQSETPATSLARLKAQWQAEALLWAHDKVVCYSDLSLNIILERAAELRRQAEENGDA